MTAEAAGRGGKPYIPWRRTPIQSPQERRRVLAELYPALEKGSRWWLRFGFMMSLSVVVATMGLSESSAAVVIGAMLIAPLMTPVLGIAASVAMAWPRRLWDSALATAGGTVMAIGQAWALTKLLPPSDQALTGEILARTSPDLRDLLVGLAAGAAGAYAVSREDVSAALPGVAVAVALVPPLATVGFTLAIGQTDLAGGALLLYVTNLVAIVLAAVLVLLAVGFVPSGRRERVAHRIRLGVLATVVALAAVAVPLAKRSAAHANTTRLVTEAALSWLKAYPGLKLGDLSIQGPQVTVAVTGATAPPSSDSLVRPLQGILGPGASVQVRWFQTTRTTAASPSPATTVKLSAAQLRPIVEAWLATVAGGSETTDITSIEVDDTSVAVQLRGPIAEPSPAALAKAISDREGRAITVSIDWREPAAATTTRPTASTTVPAATATAPP